jgi:ABC-2 type transport system permease protein
MTAATTATARPSLLVRYGRLLGVQVRVSAVTAMQYRNDFLVRGFVTCLWMSVTLLPIFVVFGARKEIAGWSLHEALVVVGWFALVRAILEGGVSPSLTAVVEHVRRGTLDFILLKPADAQFLVSTAKFEPWRVIDIAGALAIFVYAFSHLGRWPGAREVALGFAFLGLAIVVLYSFWILVVSAAFWVVKVDNLSYLFQSLFDMGRWPVTMFKGFFRGALYYVFTFVFPLALMTTYPALALLGKLTTANAALACLGGLVFAAVARAVWNRALRMYTSASS